mmetsp:Transcript_27286/g.89085  ORF Transcript_27286/g.89085 Transcript_27286/m.89085 type:complete len:221 (-) Transcript_27286:268-930(-)
MLSPLLYPSPPPPRLLRHPCQLPQACLRGFLPRLMAVRALPSARFCLSWLRLPLLRWCLCPHGQVSPRSSFAPPFLNVRSGIPSPFQPCIFQHFPTLMAQPESSSSISLLASDRPSVKNLQRGDVVHKELEINFRQVPADWVWLQHQLLEVRTRPEVLDRLEISEVVVSEPELFEVHKVTYAPQVRQLVLAEVQDLQVLQLPYPLYIQDLIVRQVQPHQA